MKSLIASLLFVFSVSAGAAEPRIADSDFCQTVDEVAGFVGSAGAGLAAGGLAVDSVALAAGTSAVAHSSEMLILTGSAGYVGSSIGTAGTALVAAAPAVIATGLAVAGGAGASYAYCRYADRALSWYDSWRFDDLF